MITIEWSCNDNEIKDDYYIKHFQVHEWRDAVKFLEGIRLMENLELLAFRAPMSFFAHVAKLDTQTIISVYGMLPNVDGVRMEFRK